MEQVEKEWRENVIEHDDTAHEDETVQQEAILEDGLKFGRMAKEAEQVRNVVGRCVDPSLVQLKFGVIVLWGDFDACREVFVGLDE